MTHAYAAPRAIRRIAARREYRVPGTRRTVVVTLGVPEPVPGSDWGCALQITGLRSAWRRPRYVFGIDGFQALHLAMQCATAILGPLEGTLDFVGQTDDLFMPRFLPYLPPAERPRLEALIERELQRLVERAKRRHSRARFSPRSSPARPGTRATRRRS